jgi:hypothetical protein
MSGDLFSLGRFGPKLQCEIPLPVDPNATLREDEFAAAATVLGSPEGSAEHPFKVGKTPVVAVRHQRTKEDFEGKGYTVVIGRDPGSAQIVIRSDEEKHVSARHAEIQFRSRGVVVIRDLGSKNGTRLNDVPVKAETELKVGDVLELGAPATTLHVTKLES